MQELRDDSSPLGPGVRRRDCSLPRSPRRHHSHQTSRNNPARRGLAALIDSSEDSVALAISPVCYLSADGRGKARCFEDDLPPRWSGRVQAPTGERPLPSAASGHAEMETRRKLSVLVVERWDGVVNPRRRSCPKLPRGRCRQLFRHGGDDLNNKQVMRQDDVCHVEMDGIPHIPASYPRFLRGVGDKLGLGAGIHSQQSVQGEVCLQEGGVVAPESSRQPLESHGLSQTSLNSWALVTLMRLA